MELNTRLLERVLRIQSISEQLLDVRNGALAGEQQRRIESIRSASQGLLEHVNVYLSTTGTEDDLWNAAKVICAELRTPTAVIETNCYLVGHPRNAGNLNEKQMHYLQKIRETNQLLAHENNLLSEALHSR